MTPTPPEDDDGALYLFYATDFLDHPRVGTGTVVDRLLDPFTPKGEARPVTAAATTGKFTTHTGPRKAGCAGTPSKGHSSSTTAGNITRCSAAATGQIPSYGVSYATSDRLDRTDEWDQAADGVQVLPVLRTIPGKVSGPGHNSVVRGPDNRQLYCVYHRWAEDGSVRQMAIDPLRWAGERLIMLGQSWATAIPDLAGHYWF